MTSFRISSLSSILSTMGFSEYVHVGGKTTYSNYSAAPSHPQSAGRLFGCQTGLFFNCHFQQSRTLLAIPINPQCNNGLCKTQLKLHQHCKLSSSRTKNPKCHVKLQARPFCEQKSTTDNLPSVICCMTFFQNSARDTRRTLTSARETNTR